MLAQLYASAAINKKMKHKKTNNDEVTEHAVKVADETYPGPDAWATIPLISGNDYQSNAKIVQRMIDHPELISKIKSHIAKNEMADDNYGVNFNGYVNGN